METRNTVVPPITRKTIKYFWVDLSSLEPGVGDAGRGLFLSVWCNRLVGDGIGDGGDVSGGVMLFILTRNSRSLLIVAFSTFLLKIF